MKTQIANKLNMYKSEIDVCAANQSAWISVPAFDGYFNILKAKVQLIDVLAYKQAQAVVGVTAVKNKERIKVADKAEVIVSGLRSLAASTGDDNLEEQLLLRYSYFTTGRISRSMQLFDRIVELALTHAADLPSEGVSQQHIDDFIAARDHFSTTISKPRAAIILRKTYTAQIAELVKEVDSLLKNNIDKLVKVLKSAQPEFYLHYMAARTVIDYKGKSYSPGTTDLPLPPDGAAGAK